MIATDEQVRAEPYKYLDAEHDALVDSWAAGDLDGQLFLDCFEALREYYFYEGSKGNAN